MSWGTNFVITIILTHVKHRMLSSIMTLAEFLQNVAQFTFYCILGIMEQVFRFRFALGS